MVIRRQNAVIVGMLVWVMSVRGSAWADTLSDGRELVRSGAFEAALPVLGQADKERPDDPEPHELLAKAIRSPVPTRGGDGGAHDGHVLAPDDDGPVDAVPGAVDGADRAAGAARACIPERCLPQVLPAIKEMVRTFEPIM